MSLLICMSLAERQLVLIFPMNRNQHRNKFQSRSLFHMHSVRGLAYTR